MLEQIVDYISIAACVILFASAAYEKLKVILLPPQE